MQSGHIVHPNIVKLCITKYFAELQLQFKNKNANPTFFQLLCKTQTRDSAIAERPRCRVRYSFRQK